MSDQFDKRYYDRYYGDPDTRVASDEEIARLVHFVSSYVKYLDLPVKRVLDMGCGLGRWRPLVETQFPRAEYTGVEVSAYVAETYGWINASATSYKPRGKFDLIICQDVFQYLNNADARQGIANFGKWCRGVLYFAALTEADWHENVDQELTDADAHLRTGKWYRRELEKYFIPAGGSLFIHKSADVVLYELEHG